MTTLDRIRGMFVGAFLGDSLGAPYEFSRGKTINYSGILDRDTVLRMQYHTRVLSPGQGTDDTEMTLALLRTIIRDGGYNKDNVILSYLNWANSGIWMGKNTKALFKGVKTIKGYQKRYSQHQMTQSNGHLMRATPLALLSDSNCIITDCGLTNHNMISFDCNIVYVICLKYALMGYNKQDIFNIAKNIAQTPEVKDILFQVEKGEIRNLVENKGWCLNAIWCCMFALIHFDNYKSAIDWLNSSQPGSDCDTNSCIAGGLLGAIYGFDILRSDNITANNINILLNLDITTSKSPRSPEYGLMDFYELTEAAYNIYMLLHK